MESKKRDTDFMHYAGWDGKKWVTPVEVTLKFEESGVKIKNCPQKRNDALARCGLNCRYFSKVIHKNKQDIVLCMYAAEPIEEANRIFKVGVKNKEDKK